MNKKKHIIIFSLIALVAITVYLIFFAYTNNAMGVDTGYPLNSIEDRVARELNLHLYEGSKVDYVETEGIVFAIRGDVEDTADYVVLTKNEEGIYIPDKGELINGISEERLNSAKKNVDFANEAIYLKDGKYICYVALPGYTEYFREDGFSVVHKDENADSLDIENIVVKDNYGHTLEYIGDDERRLYYYVADSLPNDYQIIVDYEGEEKVWLDVAAGQQ